MTTVCCHVDLIGKPHEVVNDYNICQQCTDLVFQFELNISNDQQGVLKQVVNTNWKSYIRLHNERSAIRLGPITTHRPTSNR